MVVNAEDLKRLVRTAEEKGATKAAAILSSAIVLDPRVELKCRVPLCPNYGRSLTCPPNVMRPERFSVLLNHYTYAILVQKRYGMNDFVKPDISYQELESSPDYLSSTRKIFKDFTELMSALESESMRAGYRFSAAFTGGPCCLCDECAGPGKPCRHAFQARPSMEAMGIDVIATAASAQMPVEYPAKDFATMTGLLLVD